MEVVKNSSTEWCGSFYLVIFYSSASFGQKSFDQLTFGILGVCCTNHTETFYLRKSTFLKFNSTKLAFLIAISQNGSCKKLQYINNEVDHFTRVIFYSSTSFGQKSFSQLTFGWHHVLVDTTITLSFGWHFA
jgi:hypothetical protein